MAGASRVHLGPQNLLSSCEPPTGFRVSINRVAAQKTNYAVSQAP